MSPMNMSRWCVSALAALAATATLSARSPQVFRAGVDVVELNVVVSSGNRFVGGLTVGDFAVSDNGLAQTVTSVSRETMPIDVTLVIDSSASIDKNLAGAIVTAGHKIRDQLRPDDRVSLVTFNQLIHERLALSAPASAGAVDLGRRIGATSLNDAIAVALTTPPPVERRSMALVFTDGFDTMSFLDEARVLDIAGRSRTVLFIVARATNPRAVPRAFFDALAEATGGLVQLVAPFVIDHTVGPGQNQMKSNPALLDAAFLKALDDFRSAYVVRYTLTGVRPGWHDVVVRASKSGKRYDVRTRKGYLLVGRQP
jgi:hypothetical protein